jgi:hypothetical protein
VFQNEELKTFVSKKAEGSVQFRMSHNEELGDLYRSPSTVAKCRDYSEPDMRTEFWWGNIFGFEEGRGMKLAWNRI